MIGRARLPRMAECRDCTLPIRFVHMPSGKRMPVNPAPLRANDDRAGGVAAHLAGGELHGYVITDQRPADARSPWRFRPHGATCEARGRPAPAPAPPVEEPLW